MDLVARRARQTTARFTRYTVTEGLVVGVTGATGFLGQRLVEHLTGREDLRVRALSRNISSELVEHARLEWFQGDLISARDCAAFVQGLDAVAHLAHTNTPMTSDRDLVSDAGLNLLPSLTLLEAIRSAGTVPHLIYAASGGAVYRPSTGRKPFDESAATEPFSSYGILKLAFEDYLRLGATEGWLTATSLRIGNAYGALLNPERMQGFIGVALHELAVSRPIRVFGDLGNIRDYVHLDDIASAFELALRRRPSAFEVYNIGTGKGASVEELITILCRVAGVPRAFELDAGNAERARHLPQWVVLDAGKAKRELGWSAEVELRDGIRAMWDHRRR
jgi:UDP-glucose 4-epimerase